MGKTEAFCTKCGSLINIDDTKNINKCIFCGIEVETKKALDLKTDDQTRLAIQKEAQANEKELAKSKKNEVKSNKSSKVEPVTPAVKEIIVMKPLPFKTKLIMILSIVAVIAIIAGYFVPTIINRNAKRTEFSSQFTEELPFAIKSYSFKFNDNREFLVATDIDISEGTATTAYEAYVNMYSKIYNASKESVLKKLTVRVYGKNGLFICRQSDGKLLVLFETSTPTPSPVPTQSIKNP